MGILRLYQLKFDYFCTQGGTCENFDRDARVTFFGVEIYENVIFLGFAKLASFFWG